MLEKKIKILATFLFLSMLSCTAYSSECVVLLHGLARTSNSMNELASKLAENNYIVVNVDYPSRDLEIEPLAELAVSEGLKNCENQNAKPINFVTHSLGGILVRQYYSQHSPENVKRVVMLGPPNHGSEVVDSFKNVPGFELLNGPSGMQLGTDELSVPAHLGAPNFELGIIAGTSSINLILSTVLPNPNDGKVSVESAKIDGMCGFVSLPVTHTFMMANDLVISEVISFLQNGIFKSEGAVSRVCDRR